MPPDLMTWRAASTTSTSRQPELTEPKKRVPSAETAMHEPGERGALPETATTVASANGAFASIQGLSWGQKGNIAGN